MCIPYNGMDLKTILSLSDFKTFSSFQKSVLESTWWLKWHFPVRTYLLNHHEEIVYYIESAVLRWYGGMKIDRMWLLFHRRNLFSGRNLFKQGSNLQGLKSFIQITTLYFLPQYVYIMCLVSHRVRICFECSMYI